jgi:hypothetical protein
MMLHTTFSLLRRAGACAEGYKKLAKALGGVQKYGADKHIPLLTVLDSNGLADALWCLRAVLPEEEAARDRLARLFACLCSREIWHLFTDDRSRKAVEVAEKYAVGLATEEELTAARAAAWAAAQAAARAAAWAAAGAAAGDAAGAAARAAAWAAAGAAAGAAEGDAAGAAARAAAWAAAQAAARAKQAEILREMLEATR